VTGPGSGKVLAVARPRKLNTDAHLRALAACLAVGYSYREAGPALGVSDRTVYRTRTRREPERMQALIAEEAEVQRSRWLIRHEFALPDGPPMDDAAFADLERRKAALERRWRREARGAASPPSSRRRPIARGRRGRSTPAWRCPGLP
jgi:transposase